MSKPVSFPAYRRSHFRSQTYLTLVRIFSHFPATPDNGSDRMEQEEPEKGPQFSDFTGSASVDREDPVLEKTTHEVHEITGGVGNKGRESTTNDVVLHDIEHMLGIKEVENSLTRQEENMSKQENDFTEQQKMDGDCGFVRKPTNRDQENSTISKVDVNDKKRHGPGLEETKTKTKQKKRKNQAQNDKQLGVKRLRLPSVPKAKSTAYCRHYLVGRCHEGDKCRFSHDTMPLTKSTPCRHFARQSCMKGDDCLFDHELSKYPCKNFVTKGFCRRGDACLFSHEIPIKGDSFRPSKISRSELKSPPMSRNTSFNMPPNSLGSSIRQNHFINSMGICCNISSKDKVADILHKQLPPAPKGIRFINIAKSSLPNPSTLEQGMMTHNKEIIVQSVASANPNASSKNQTLVEIANKKLPSVAPKGANFLSFGKGSVFNFGSSVTSPFAALKVV